MDRERLDLWCEKGILGLVLAILVYGPLATGAVLARDFLVIQALTLAVVCLWLIRVWVKPGYRLLWPPIAWVVAAFVAYAVFEYQRAAIEYVARQELIRVLVYGVLFLAILDNLHRQESAIHPVVFTLAILAIGLSLYAIYQYLTRSPYVWDPTKFEVFLKPEQYKHRASATYICPNNLAGFLEMILPLGLAFMLTSRLKPALKVFLGYAAVMALAGIGVSLSRGGWIATGAALLVFFGLLLRSRANRLPAILFLVLLVGAGIYFVNDAYRPKERLEKLFRDEEPTDIRVHLWKPAIDIWVENYWFGGGPGHFDYRFREHRPGHIQMRPKWAHNDYLNTLADWGAVGGVLVVAAFGLLYYGIFTGWRFVRRSNDLTTKPGNRSAFVVGAAIGILAILLHSFVDFNMQVPANALTAVTLMALASSYLRFATERYWLNPKWLGRSAMTALGLGAVIYLGAQGVRRAAEEQWLRRADRAERAGDLEQTIAALKQAHQAEPQNAETTYRVGELFRRQCWLGLAGYRDLAEEAMRWFELGMRTNPLDGYNFLRYGMCLDWLGRHAEAADYFLRALELDPQSYYVVAHQGWHAYTAGDYAAAREWLERSHELKYMNEIYRDYRPLLERLLDRKSN